MSEDLKEQIVELDVKLELKDYVRFKFWYSRKNLISITISLGIIILGSLFLTTTSNMNNSVVIAVLAISIALIIFLVFYIYFSSKRYLESDKIVQKENHIVISDDGASITAESYSFKIKWDNVYRINELKYSFAIFVSEQHAYIIPKRCFKLDKHIKLFKSILMENIDYKKLKIKKF